MVKIFWSNNYIKYKCKGDIKTLSDEEYLNKIKPPIKDIIIDLKKSNTWKIRLTTTIEFIFCKDDDDEEREMHSKSDKYLCIQMEIMINDEVNEVMEKLFESFKEDIKISWNNQGKVVRLSLIMLIYCIINVIK